MVVVTLPYADLVALLGKEVSLAELEEAIPMMGAAHEGREGKALRMEFNPDRPDLYSVEGVARALRSFLDLEEDPPAYAVKVSGIDFLVEKSVKGVRPVAVGAVVRDVTLTEDLLASIVELQERLHAGPGRNRRRVAIGLHDLETVEPPFRYRGVRADEAPFVPLGGSEPMTPGAILTDHPKGREYGWILEGADRFPLIQDAEDRVLSFPPIINGVVTQLTPETRHLFVDVTGTNRAAVEGALHILVTALAERGGSLESVTVLREEDARDTPDLSPRHLAVSLARANELLGLQLSRSEATACLRRMGMDAQGTGDRLDVAVPPYRMDVLHEVDVMEDLAVGYGIDRIVPVLPRAMTVGAARPEGDFDEALREVLVGHGLQEVRTLTFQDADLPYRPPEPPLHLKNPITEELETVRVALLPAVLEILRLNRRRELPQRIFEMGDVVRGGRNRRHAAGALVHAKAGFAEVKGLVLGLFRDLGLEATFEEAEDPNFLPGRCARAVLGGESAGLLGEVHPAVLTAYELTNPVAAFELDARTLFELRRAEEG